MLEPYSEASKPISQDWGKVVGRCWRLILKQANLSARTGVKASVGSLLAPYSEASKHVSQDWGKVVGRCWRHYSESSKQTLSSQDWGKVVDRGAGALILKQANLS